MGETYTVIAMAWWLPLPKVAAALVGFDGGSIWEEEQLGRWDPASTDGWMKREEAGRWADYYLGVNGNKGAEICQGAADDLVKFLDQLESFAHEHPESKLNLVQTGDFLDFWIGFKCGFGERAVLKASAHGFVEHWYDLMAKEEAERAGKVMAKFKRLREKKGSNLEVTLLYGNHDNYLRTTHGLKSEHCPARSIVFAEHGHQSDSFNSDEEPRWGWALTQAAFLKPMIRDKEDSLAAGLTRVSGTGASS